MHKSPRGRFQGPTEGGEGAGAKRNLFALLGPLPPPPHYQTNQKSRDNCKVLNMHLRCIKFYFHLLTDVTSCLQITENAPPFQFVESGAPLTAMILPEHHPVITGKKHNKLTSRKKHLFVYRTTPRQYTISPLFLSISICMQIWSPRGLQWISRSFGPLTFLLESLHKDGYCQ